MSDSTGRKAFRSGLCRYESFRLLHDSFRGEVLWDSFVISTEFGGRRHTQIPSLVPEI